MTRPNNQPQLAEQSDEELLLDFQSSGNPVGVRAVSASLRKRTIQLPTAIPGGRGNGGRRLPSHVSPVVSQSGTIRRGPEVSALALRAVATNQAIDAQRTV